MRSGCAFIESAIVPRFIGISDPIQFASPPPPVDAMKANEILDEIHSVREERARACGYDIHEIRAEICRNTGKLKAEGWPVVSLASRETEAAGALRQEPPKPPNS